VPFGDIRPGVCPGVRAVVCVPPVEFAHCHPGRSDVAALNIRHGRQGIRFESRPQSRQGIRAFGQQASQRPRSRERCAVSRTGSLQQMQQATPR
jgi:hypothetical protein